MSITTATELWRMSATELAEAIRFRQISSQEVIEAHLQRIDMVNGSIKMADIARYVAALLRIAAKEHGSVLRPETVATMFRPHFQPDPRVPGMGLAFELGEEGGQRTVGKTGIVSGFHSAMALAPEGGIGVLVFCNTGGLDGRGAPIPLATMLLRLLLGLSVDPIRIDIAPRPETWSEICGWYSPAPVRLPTCPRERSWGPDQRSWFRVAI